MKKGKLIVVSAPSGCGKSTIINALMDSGDFNLDFSVSATNRTPREGEIDGVHYRFLSTKAFQEAIDRGEFVEWEEVYPGRYYGTLRSEIDRRLVAGGDVVLDIDVNGALNVKKAYGAQCLTVFIQPPSIEELRHRLEARGTETAEVIDTRINRAEYEIAQAPLFDTTIVNDNLDKAIAEAHEVFTRFINS